ncbi:MAG: hypothetical protein QOJ15_937 [Bradyrhizobium sp.]|jgi:hypothetical protein|nr:hypothetical protein [Bradyrhizobium sp.]
MDKAKNVGTRPADAERLLEAGAAAPIRLGGTSASTGQNVPGVWCPCLGQLQFKIEQHNNRIQDLNIIVKSSRLPETRMTGAALGQRPGK